MSPGPGNPGEQGNFIPTLKALGEVWRGTQAHIYDLFLLRFQWWEGGVCQFRGMPPPPSTGLRLSCGCSWVASFLSESLVVTMTVSVPPMGDWSGREHRNPQIRHCLGRSVGEWLLSEVGTALQDWDMRCEVCANRTGIEVTEQWCCHVLHTVCTRILR